MTTTDLAYAVNDETMQVRGYSGVLMTSYDAGYVVVYGSPACEPRIAERLRKRGYTLKAYFLSASQRARLHCPADTLAVKVSKRSRSARRARGARPAR